MTEILLGMLGAALMMAAFALGVSMGQKRTGGGREPEPPAEKETATEVETQRAFEELLNYNSGTAYGLNNGINGGDEV